MIKNILFTALISVNYALVPAFSLSGNTAGLSSNEFLISSGTNLLDIEDRGGLSLPYRVFREDSGGDIWGGVGTFYAVFSLRVGATSTPTLREKSLHSMFTMNVSYPYNTNPYLMPFFVPSNTAFESDLDDIRSYETSNFLYFAPTDYTNFLYVNIYLPYNTETISNDFNTFDAFVNALKVNYYMLYTEYQYESLNDVTWRFWGAGSITNPIKYTSSFLQGRAISYAFEFNNVNIAQFMTLTARIDAKAIAKEAYDRGYADSLKNQVAQSDLLSRSIFITIGSIGTFIGYLSQFEILGVSLAMIIGIFVSIGLAVLIIKMVK